ncbi:universal stress protein [Mycobacteroides franklinii]|uniref:Universal stress protein n=2 Tax=Mycobacteroides franklinii TaxID=948102 RepID=A0A4R5P8L0_9MYCO|nr:universal stress protein [Mycobacteroides franklinii]ORA60055.1 universal stress protein [Mycobacteroides franklinii]TDH20197.1 universal stress protein [Mycobacteroides franklinii]
MLSETHHSGIVVGVDGSSCSDAAVRWAAKESRMRNESLTVVSAFDIEQTHVYDQQLRERIYQSRERHAQLILENAWRTAEEAADGPLSRAHGQVAFGHPVPTLVDAAQNARVLVVGSRGLHTLDRLRLGSTSTAVLHHARCPVAVIHDEAILDNHAPILLGVDGSPTSEKATAIAFDEASHRKVALIAVHAWHMPDFFEPAFDLQATENQEKQTLAERLAGWQERYPDVKVDRRVVCDYPAPYLTAESTQSQLVVVGSHGRGGFAGMLLGSVSSTVAQATRVPVIVARQP